MGDENLGGGFIFQVQEGGVNGEGFVIKTLPNRCPREAGILVGEFPQMSLGVEVGAHDLCQRGALIRQSKSEGRVKDMLYTGSVSGVEGWNVQSSAVLVDMAGVGDEEQGGDALESGFEFCGRSFV